MKNLRNNKMNLKSEEISIVMKRRFNRGIEKKVYEINE